MSGTPFPDSVPLVKDAIAALFFGDQPDRMEAFCRFLKEKGALVAGGFILRLLTGERLTKQRNALINENEDEELIDLDVYTPIQHTRETLQQFQDVQQNEVLIRSSSLYCRSFLQRNGIRSVNTLHLKNQNAVDVMSVRKSRSPLDVVTNFDLTFCQVWFDGTMVFASHPDHVTSKKGKLQGDYVETLLLGNKFLARSVRRYKARGFQITFDHSPTIDSLEAVRTRPREPRPVRARHAIWRLVMRLVSDPDFDLTQDKYRQVLPSLPMNRDYVVCDNGIEAIHVGQRGKIFVPMDRLRSYDDEDSEDEEDQKKVPEETYRGILTNLFIQSLADLEHVREAQEEDEKDLGLDDDEKRDRRIDINLNHLKEYSPDLVYLKEWKSVLLDMLPHGEDELGDEGPLLFFHGHTADGQGLTPASLQSYLKSKLSESDAARKSVPCYLKIAGIHECPKTYTLAEIQPSVTTSFFNKWTRTIQVRKGLNQILPLYDAVLYNQKTQDPAGFGDIFGSGMCPFCLQFESRVEGCAYMTHTRNADSMRHSPFCHKDLVNMDLFRRYQKRAQDIISEEMGHEAPLEMVHVEFCIECGRPCAAHQHFDMADPPELVPKPRAPLPAGMTAYGICTGGGRRELVGRILTVRDTFDAKEATDPLQERILASQKADRSPLDEALLTRADAILAVEGDARKWNKEVKAIPHYPNDPAYNHENNENQGNGDNEDNGDEKEDENQNEENEAPALVGGRRQAMKKLRQQFNELKNKTARALQAM